MKIKSFLYLFAFRIYNSVSVGWSVSKFNVSFVEIPIKACWKQYYTGKAIPYYAYLHSFQLQNNNEFKECLRVNSTNIINVKVCMPR